MSKLSTLKIRPLFSFSLACLFIFYQFILQVYPSAMMKGIIINLHVNASTVSYISSLFYYAFALSLLPVGWLVDRYSRKLMLLVGLLLCVLGCLISGLIESLFLMYMGRVLMGFGGAFAFVSTMKLVSTFFSNQLSGVFSGIAIASAMLGAFFGQRFLHIIIGVYGFLGVFLALGIVGLALITLTVMFFSEAEGERKVSANFLSDVKNIVKNKINWKLAVFAGVIYIPLPTFAGLWGAEFLSVVHLIPYVDALQSVSLVWLGMAIGSPCLGLLSDKTGGSVRVILYSCFFVVFLLGIIIFSPMKSLLGMGILLFMTGFFCGSYTLAFVVARKEGQENQAALLTSFIVVVVMLSTALATQLIGLLLTVAHSEVSYFRYFKFFLDFKVLMAAIPIFILLSMLIIFPLQSESKRGRL